jgi:hypothetical protein
MTAYDEAERAAHEALCNLPAQRWNARDAAVAVVVPILAEHFAQAVEDAADETFATHDAAYADALHDAARVIRDLTPTKENR